METGVFWGERTTTAVGVQPKRVQRLNTAWTGLRAPHARRRAQQRDCLMFSAWNWACSAI